jgi:hypothetical protein
MTIPKLTEDERHYLANYCQTDGVKALQIIDELTTRVYQLERSVAGAARFKMELDRLKGE